MLTNTWGTRDLWISEMVLAHFLLYNIPSTQFMPTICYLLAWCATQNSTVLSFMPAGHRFRMRSTIHGFSVNMQSPTRSREWGELWTNGMMRLVCVMSVALCKIRDGGEGGGLSHRASELGHNGIKNTDWNYLSRVCGADRKIEGRMTQKEERKEEEERNGVGKRPHMANQIL